MKNTSVPLDQMIIKADRSETVTWQGCEALRLENGLALLPDRTVADVSIQVMIGTDGPAYSGIAFRIADTLNYELAYTQPHTSGQWDAIQYDPVWHGRNTWQIYCGPCYQRAAQVPTGQWFRLKVDVCGQRAAISVDDQPPLVVEHLAHWPAAGLVGLWTYRPAYFCDLRVSACDGLNVPSGEMPTPSRDAVTAWFAEGYGVMTCEPNGTLNLNRCVPVSVDSVRLIRRFEIVEAGEITFKLGFSDALSLDLDGQKIFEGENTFTGFADRAARGYIEQTTSLARRLAYRVEAGAHCLTADLRATEGFGWGLALDAHAAGLRLLPAELG